MSERNNDINNVVISGEISYLKSGKSEKGAWAFCSIGIQNKNKYGTFTTRIKCNAFGTAAEAMALGKDGELAVVSGSISSKEKKDKDADPNAKKVYETVVDVKQIQFITASASPAKHAEPEAASDGKREDDDMPF